MKQIIKNPILMIPFFSAFVTALIYLIIYLKTDAISSFDRIIIFSKPTWSFWDLPASIDLTTKVSHLWDIAVVFWLVYFLVRWIVSKSINLYDSSDQPFPLFDVFIYPAIGFVLFLMFIMIAGGVFMFSHGQVALSLAVSFSICGAACFVLGVAISSDFDFNKVLDYSAWCFFASFMFGFYIAISYAVFYGPINGLVINIILAALFASLNIIGTVMGHYVFIPIFVKSLKFLAHHWR